MTRASSPPSPATPSPSSAKSPSSPSPPSSSSSPSAPPPPLPTSLPRVTLAAATLLAGLTLAALPGGAPTHHAGRALLTLWLLAALYLGRAALTPLAFAWRRVLLPAIPTLLVLGALILRPWYARLDSWSPRPHATTIGAAAARATTGPILLEVRDYAFFAVEAGSGAPWRFVEDRSIDPRKPPEPSSFATPDRLQARASTQSAIVGIDTPTARQALGPPNTTAGPWALWTP
ncbi:MAG: hypothetical protein R3B72_18220 [Polyangiaceae bacterium]